MHKLIERIPRLLGMKKIKNQFLAAMMFLILISVPALGIMSYRISASIIERNHTRSYKSSLQTSGRILEATLDSIVSASRTFLYDQEFLLAAQNTSFAHDPDGKRARDALLQEINEELPDDADLSDTKAYLSSHEALLQETACRIVRQNGFDYPVEFRLEPWYFPTKTYGDMTFPSGTYDAFRVIIGKGEGKNWWCVLYPSLCFIDSTYSIVPDSSKAALRDTLQADTYESLLQQKPQAGFRLGEWLKRLF